MGLEYPVRLRSIEAYIVAKHGSAREMSIGEIETLDEWADTIVNTIEEEWPVDTSTSRDAFAYTLDDDGVGFTIENDTDYVQYIHRAGTPAEPPLYETLIPEVIGRHGGPMLAAMRAAVDATEAEFAKATTKAARKRVFAGVAHAR